jgi:hypothetical protein
MVFLYCLPLLFAALGDYEIQGDFYMQSGKKIIEGSNEVTVSEIDDAHDHISADGSEHTFIDQDVTSGSAPTFTADNFSDGGSNAIVTTTQETNWDNHIADNTQAHTDYLLNNANDTTSGTLTAAAFIADNTTLDGDVLTSTGALGLTSNGTIAIQGTGGDDALVFGASRNGFTTTNMYGTNLNVYQTAIDFVSGSTSIDGTRVTWSDLGAVQDAYFDGTTNMVVGNIDDSSGTITFNDQIGYGAITSSKDITTGDQYLGPDGAAADPTYSFTNDTGTGMFLTSSVTHTTRIASDGARVADLMQLV